MAPEKPVKEKHITDESVSVDDILAQANDGISLAQIIDVTMQEVGQMLADMYYQLEAASQNSACNYVEVNNQLRDQIEQLDAYFKQVQFQQQAIFQQPGERIIPKGVGKDDKVTINIPNTQLNQLGLLSWQLTDGPVLPKRQADKLVFTFDNLRLRHDERISLVIGDVNVLEECVVDLNTSMQTVADLINLAELDWLNEAIVTDGQLSLKAPLKIQAALSIESQQVAVEDSLASLQVQHKAHLTQAMQVIVGSVNRLADYRDVATSIATELHDAVFKLMSAPVNNAMSDPLAKALAKDVEKAFQQQPLQSMLAQANIED